MPFKNWIPTGALMALLLAPAASAQPSDSQTACAAYSDSEAVFVGRAGLPVKRWLRFDDSAPALMTLTPIAVESTYKGVPRSVAYLTPFSPARDTVAGRTYLVYGRHYQSPGVFMASLGRGVKEVESAAEDLAFLESLSPGARGGRIYGTLERRGDERTDTGERLPGVEIRILNKTHSTTAVTEIDGHFSADGLPAGTYELVPELPPALVVWDATSRIIAIVADGGCAESHILARSEGRVRGVLRDADGKPLQYSVTLLPMDVAPDSVGHVKGMGSVSTDADGVFDFRGRAPGRYSLGVNLANGPGPYVPTYYPGTPDRSAAVPIDVRRGETIDGLDFSVPPQRATGRLELRVESDLTGRFEICTSAPDTMVVGWSTFEIEAGKTLSIEVFDGVRYRVHAHVRLAGGRHLESDWHEIVASTDTTAVTLLPDAPRDLHPHPR